MLVGWVLLYVHRNRRFIRDGSPGRPPRLSHSYSIYHTFSSSSSSSSSSSRQISDNIWDTVLAMNSLNSKWRPRSILRHAETVAQSYSWNRHIVSVRIVLLFPPQISHHCPQLRLPGKKTKRWGLRWLHLGAWKFVDDFEAGAVSDLALKAPAGTNGHKVLKLWR